MLSVKSEAPVSAFTRSLYVPVTSGVNVSVFGFSGPSACATGFDEPGAIRYRARFAPTFTQSRVESIGTDTSPTWIVNVLTELPPTSTLPLNLAVMVAAGELAAVSARAAAARRGTPVAAPRAR